MALKPKRIVSTIAKPKHAFSIWHAVGPLPYALKSAVVFGLEQSVQEMARSSAVVAINVAQRPMSSKATKWELVLVCRQQRRVPSVQTVASTAVMKARRR